MQHSIERVAGSIQITDMNFQNKNNKRISINVMTTNYMKKETEPPPKMCISNKPKTKDSLQLITLMMEAVRTSETSVYFNVTQCYIPEDSKFNTPMLYSSSLKVLHHWSDISKRYEQLCVH
jgi:endo-1,4-beta-D-glucanase Y